MLRINQRLLNCGARRAALRPYSLMLAGTWLLRQLGCIFRENSLPLSHPGAMELDRKRIRQLREKAQAMGRKYSPTMQM